MNKQKISDENVKLKIRDENVKLVLDSSMKLENS